MNKNLRSKKGTEGAMDSREDGKEPTVQIRLLVAKMDELTAASQSCHDDILRKLKRLEEKSNTVSNDITDLKKSLEFANSEAKAVKHNLAAKADQSCVDELAKKIDDLENCSKQNNIVIWNVPEESEKEFSSCEALVKNILYNFMGLDEDVEVTRAHRTAIDVLGLVSTCFKVDSNLRR